jgi:class 3 adenylate cyclase/tetratricopeptide (TPR) repeat protein/type II secretory pathway predicted ATPase ExeA
VPVCPVCGEANPDGFRYCGVCGAAIATARGPDVRKIVTAVFCDIVDSTGIGDRLDPESVRWLMSAYFNRMRSILERHGGTLEKFIGDAVFAVFGVPVIREDDALRAVTAAVEMRDSIAELRPQLLERFGIGIEVHIGIGTGEVVVPTSETDAAISGDILNIAARLEQTAGPGEILIGDDTYTLVRDAVRAEPLPGLRLRGKPQPVTAYRLLEVLPGAPGRARRLRSPMIGREPQLASLRDVERQVAATSSCRLVTVVGDAGVGKSRLVREFTQSTSATVFRGRCLSHQIGVTYWPIVQIVKQVAGAADVDEGAMLRSRIEAVLGDAAEAPQVARQLAAVVGSADERAPALEEIYRAVRKLLEAAARKRPVVAVIEDVHWAELELLDLIEYVVDHSISSPFMFVCEARPELLDRRPGWDGRRSAAVSIRLAPLGIEQCAALIDNLLGHGPINEEALNRIAYAADGNPLFVEELVSMLIDQGSLARERDVWTLQTDQEDVKMPLTIQTLLSARLEQLPSEERQVIQRAAVIGKLFYWRAVSELSPPDIQPRVGAHLTSLARRDLIHSEQSDFTSEDAFAFRHTLIREAAYQAAPKQVRAELHERFADWLQNAAADRTSEYEEFVGFHLERAAGYRRELGEGDARVGDLARRAAAMLASAGRRSLARADVASTVRLLDRAVALLPESDPRRTGLMGDLALALSQNGRYARAGEVLDNTVAAAAAAGDDRLAARLTVEREVVRLEVEPGRAIAEARRAADPAIETLRRLGDDRGLARGWQLIGIDYWTRCLATEAEGAFERSLAHARAAGDRFTESESLVLLVRAAFWGPMPVAEGLARCKEIRADSDGDHRVDAFALAMLGGFEALRGSFERARHLRREADATLTDLGLETERASIEMFAAEIELLAGNPEGAERALRSAFETASRLGAGGQTALINALLARVLYVLDCVPEAEEHTRLSEQTAPTDDVASAILWRSIRAKVAARSRRDDEAHSLAQEALAISDGIDFTNDRADALVDAAEVYEATGVGENAIPLLERAIELYRQKGNVVSRHRAGARLARVRAKG